MHEKLKMNKMRKKNYNVVHQLSLVKFMRYDIKCACGVLYGVILYGKNINLKGSIKGVHPPPNSA